MGSRRQFGSVRKLPSGRWQARYENEGQRYPAPVTFRSKGDAAAWLAETEASIRRGVWTDPDAGRVTLGEWAEHWLGHQPHLRPKTLTGYEAVVRGRLMPALGSLSLAEIDRGVVRGLLADMAGTGLAPGTIREARKVLSLILGAAVEARMITTNPAAGLKIARGRREEMRFLSHDQIEALAQAITSPASRGGGHGAAPWWRTDHHDLGLLVRFAAYTGLRAGEVAGLRVRDLDLEASRATVRATLAEVRGHGLVEGSPKTGRQRSVPLPGFLVEALRDHLRGKAQDDFVFCSPEGGPLRHHNFYVRHFLPATRQAGLDGVRFHDLRHSCAALLVAEGAHPRAIMERLGHSSITVTLDRYGHLFPHLEEALTAGLERSRSAALAQRPRLENPQASGTDRARRARTPVRRTLINPT